MVNVGLSADMGCAQSLGKGDDPRSADTQAMV
jgi:hypothetical protein